RNSGLVRGHGSNLHWLIAHGRSAAPGRSSLYLIQIQKSADPRNKFPAKPWSHSPYTFKFLISTMQLRFRGWDTFAPKCARPLGRRAAGRAARADTRSRPADTGTERRHPVVARRYAVVERGYLCAERGHDGMGGALCAEGVWVSARGRWACAVRGTPRHPRRSPRCRTAAPEASLRDQAPHAGRPATR